MNRTKRISYYRDLMFTYYSNGGLEISDGNFRQTFYFYTANQAEKEFRKLRKEKQNG